MYFVGDQGDVFNLIDGQPATQRGAR